jgi:hypothetical protein
MRNKTLSFIGAALIAATTIFSAAPASANPIQNAPPPVHLVGSFNPQAMARGLSADGNSSVYQYALQIASTRYLSIAGSDLAFNGKLVGADNHTLGTTMMISVGGSQWRQFNIGNFNQVIDLGVQTVAGSDVELWLYPTTNATNITLDMYTDVGAPVTTVGHPTN